ncbi:hypothetical protein CKA32_000075 [Geitlerinema sp. FC II]|nr:hypothetical protein CKA32_000075 [Geitlerinema sp. FC II]
MNKGLDSSFISLFVRSPILILNYYKNFVEIVKTLCSEKYSNLR